jgi:hypothetical protein
MVLVAASLAGGCGGEDNEAAPTQETTAATTTDAVAPTTTEAAVEPLTTDERRWLMKVRRIRPRIEAVFDRTRTLVPGTMLSLVRVLGTCKSTLREAGRASERFVPAAQIVARACRTYEKAARNFETVRSLLEGIVVKGSPEEKLVERSLDRAFTVQVNASTLMMRAEEKADQIRANIEAESSS